MTETWQPSPDTAIDTEGMAYALSHDLRARLRATGGFLELARSDVVDDADLAYFLDRAAGAAALADRMIQRLVRYLRIGPDAQVAIVEPADAVAEAVSRCPDGPETLVDPLPTVMADRDLLVDAVIEILDNASRYRAEGHRPVVRVTGTVDGRFTVLRFTDDGIGINGDRTDRAFELFRQVHRVRDTPGSGMGLPIARRSIEIQGGAMTLEPGQDSGAVVEIRLPAPPAT